MGTDSYTANRYPLHSEIVVKSKGLNLSFYGFGFLFSFTPPIIHSSLYFTLIWLILAVSHVSAFSSQIYVLWIMLLPLLASRFCILPANALLAFGSVFLWSAPATFEICQLTVACRFQGLHVCRASSAEFPVLLFGCHASLLKRNCRAAPFPGSAYPFISAILF